VKFPYLFNLPIVCPGLPSGLVDALISNTAILCRGLLVLVFHVEPVSIDVIPLPQGDLGGQARHKPRFSRFSIGRCALLFDAHHEIDLMLYLYPCLRVSVTSMADLLQVLLNPLVHYH
jgi:hypothetical protein